MIMMKSNPDKLINIDKRCRLLVTNTLLGVIMKKRLHSDRSRKISKTGQSKPKTFIADKPSELFEFLMEKMPEKSRNKIKDFLTRKQVSVNGTFISQYNHPLRAGQKVEIHTSVIKKIEQLDGLQIMYQDPD